MSEYTYLEAMIVVNVQLKAFAMLRSLSIESNELVF
jgi:hypothetical protein